MIDAGILSFVIATYANVVPLASRGASLAVVLGAFLLALVAIPAAIQVVVHRRGLLVDAPFLAMLLFLAALLVSTFAARDARTALGWIGTYLAEGILLYLLVLNAVRSQRTLQRIAWALVLTGGLLGAMSAYQEVASAYDQQFAGLAQRNLERGGEAKGGEIFRARRRVVLGNRAAGPIGDPNRYAQMLLAVLPFAVFLTRRSGSRLSRLAAAGVGVAILCGVFLTYSRGGLLALGLLAATMIGLRLLRWREVLPAALVAMLFAGTLAGGTKDRLQSIGTVRSLLADRSTATSDGAVRGRMTEMLAAMRVFMDHPFLGVGPGHFMPYYSVDYMNDPEVAYRRIMRPRRAHNLYLEIAAETGLLGLAAFLAIGGVLVIRLAGARGRWMRLAGASRRSMRLASERADLAAAHLSALLAYLTTGFFLQMAYQRYFWLIAALGGAAASVLYAHPAPDDERETAARHEIPGGETLR